MNYKYSTIDPVKNRQLYMYSNYSGSEFIESYKNSRKKAIIKCQEDIKKIKGKNSLLDNITNINDNDQKKIIKNFTNLLKIKSNFIKTESIISERNIIIDDIDCLFNNFLNHDIIEKVKIDNLVKQFEIKKSFSSYFEETLLNNSFFIDFDETYHLLFSYINSQYFIFSKSYKYLSTLLKLNDLLVYRLYNERFFNIDLLAFALKLELKIFSNIEEEMLVNQ